MEFRHEELDNGLTVIAEVNPSAASMAAGFFARTGSRDETPEVSGVSHFLEHMVFKGTAGRTAFEVNCAFDDMGAEYNASTSYENTIYYGAVLPEHQGRLLELLCDLMRPALRAEDFELEKKVILEEIALYEDQPKFRTYEKLMSAFFAGHPLGNVILGTPESIRGLKRDDMQAYFERRYSPGNVTLVGVGAVDFEGLVATARQRCAAWRPFEAPRDTPPAPGAAGREVIVDRKLVRQQIGLMSPAPPCQDRRRFAAQILATILGDHAGSRLFYALVEPAIADEAGTYYDALDAAGGFITFISAGPGAPRRPHRRRGVAALHGRGPGQGGASGRQEQDRFRRHAEGGVADGPAGRGRHGLGLSPGVHAAGGADRDAAGRRGRGGARGGAGVRPDGHHARHPRAAGRPVTGPPTTGPRPAPASVRGKRVTVVGLGHFGGGIGVTRWLCGQGARVTVSDRAPAEQLTDALGQIEGLAVTLHLGGHEERDFTEADLLVVSPAVPKDLPPIAAAERAGVPRTTELNLFLERCRCRIVGVTGTVGKSTTAAMAGAILARRFPTHVGGNIGRSLLADLPAIAPDHVVVLEMSSFQLEDVPLVGVSPHVAVVTNLSPNHLDRHGTMAAYAAAKKNIFRYQSPDDVLVLNAACEATAAWAEEAPGRVERFDPSGAQFELAVPGRHNQANAETAWAAARPFGVRREEAAAALRGFGGLPHRLAFVGERHGVEYYNDSKCTTPEGAIVALEAFAPRRAVVIAGGYDKGAGFERLGEALAARAKAVVAMGATREKIIAAIEAAGAAAPPAVHRAGSLEEAVALAAAAAGPGDVVLLAPACASYDMFTNYERRGEAFAAVVSAL